jgi:diguanylate cyclase (GGDEF)-like protein
MVYRAVEGRAETLLGMRLPRAGSISGECLRTREILIVADTDTDPRVNREACRSIGARSMVVVPLLHGDRAIGVLKVYSGVPDAFGDASTRILSILAHLVGTSLVRSDLLARLSDQAITDELTGLANRRHWDDQLELALGRCTRTGQPVSIVIVDLDGFKKVNDEHGHAAGDRLLVSVASRWSAALRTSDLLGRIGGDEFAVLLEGADEAGALDVVARLQDALPEGARASAGTATWDHDEDGPALVARADADMYEHKRSRATSAH